jgi:hypothetical protein
MSEADANLEYDNENETEDIYDFHLTAGGLLYLDMMQHIETTTWLDGDSPLEIEYKRDLAETLGWLFDGIMENDQTRINIMERVNLELNKVKAVRTIH